MIDMRLELVLRKAGVSIPVIAYGEVASDTKIDVLGHIGPAMLPQLTTPSAIHEATAQRRGSVLSSLKT